MVTAGRLLITGLVVAAVATGAACGSRSREAHAASGREPCALQSVLPELREKNPDTIDAVLDRASKTENAGAVLWRIEKSGSKPSFLFGTVHVTHTTLASLSNPVVEAIRQSRIVALEAAEMSRSAYNQAMAEGGRLMSASDKPLQRLLGDDDLRIIEKEISKAGYPPDLALGIRPWVATLFLSSSECQLKNQEQGLKPLDLLVSDEAKAQAIPIVGLETMLEQFQALASIPDEEQGLWLKASIEAHDRLDDITNTMVELYHARRIAAVWELTRAMAPRVKLTDETLDVIKNGLVGRRNKRMLENSLPHIEEGGAFIAVGAMHLVGRDGLVSELMARGYELKPIE